MEQLENNSELPLRGKARSNILPFAPQGWPFILPVACLLLLAWAFGWVISSVIWVTALIFLLNFFRDPERTIPTMKESFVAPADGRVIRAEQTPEGMRVDIFMNVFNVHVNRMPIAGKIMKVTYFPGAFINASFDKASEENERCRYDIISDDGNQKFAITQIAGLIARRIVGYVEAGSRAERGERVGMIRFGSRVDCLMPDDWELHVTVGQNVSAGETILARRKSS
ncbi:MAG: phosphatidylserine decarboxylase family protein [Mariprofundales bacterium]